MKTSLALAIAVLSLPWAVSQGQSLVYDEAMFNQAASNHTDLTNLMNQQLTKADSQLQALNQQLTRMGDYTKVNNLPATQALQNDLATSSNGLANNTQLSSITQSTTGAEVFNESMDGLFKPIGSTITKADGTVVQRDPEKYKLNAGLQNQIKEYYRVRQAATDRVSELNQELATALVALDEAPDAATATKQAALVNALQARVQEAYQEVEVASRDLDTFQKELANMAQVTVKSARDQGVAPPPGTKNNKTTTLDALKSALKQKGTMQWGTSTTTTP